jgi:L-ascorbate metabolism protein UlaG (beta-lactamase superfamily)
MIITYQGAEFFRIQFGDITLAVNPVSKESKLPQSRFGADIVLSSLHHVDMNGVDMVTHGERVPFSINGPGEYEVKEVFIKGFASESMYGGSALINTIYKVELEGMNLCFLGGIVNTEIKPEVTEELGEIDILFLPIGGQGVLDAAKAYKLAVSLAPKIIIPNPFGDIGDSQALKSFLKEAGVNPDPLPKLTLKKKDLEGKEGDVIVLESSKE